MDNSKLKIWSLLRCQMQTFIIKSFLALYSMVLRFQKVELFLNMLGIREASSCLIQKVNIV